MFPIHLSTVLPEYLTVKCSPGLLNSGRGAYNLRYRMMDDVNTTEPQLWAGYSEGLEYWGKRIRGVDDGSNHLQYIPKH